jgi:predicted sulfurtransferase
MTSERFYKYCDEKIKVTVRAKGGEIYSWRGSSYANKDRQAVHAEIRQYLRQRKQWPVCTACHEPVSPDEVEIVGDYEEPRHGMCRDEPAQKRGKQWIP